MKVKVTEKQVMITEISEVFEGEFGINRCDFTLPKSFEGLSVTAIFNGIPVPLTEGKCIIPALPNGNCILGVYAYRKNGEETELMYSPKPTMFFVGKGSFCRDINEEIIPEVFEYETYCQMLQGYWREILNSNTLPEFVEDATQYQYYSAKVINELIGDIGNGGGDNVKDGVSINSVEQTTTSTEDNGNNVITVTLSDGQTSIFTVKNGSKGSQGVQGEKGEQGEKGVQGEKGDKGDKGDTGSKGADGYTPVKGTDYFTEADKAEMVADVKASIEGIPDYWQSELDTGVEEIRRAMEGAGRNKSSFFFYSDAHWANENTYTSKLAPTLLKYLYKKTPINKTNFGGDIVFGEGSSDTDAMEYLWDWREQLRDLPNHHSVIGNHDDGHSTNDRILSKEYIYSYLLAPEENNDIVWGGDFYYYIDDKAENTRYLYLDVFYEGISSSQTEFVKEAIKTVPADWHIVVVAHAWFGVDYGTTDNPIYPPVLNGFATEVQGLLGMFDNYNAREGEFAECGGWVELCIGGHYHLDHYEHTNGGIPVIIVEADTFHDRGGTMPTHGNTSESAVSAVVVDYNDKIVKVIRVGRGESYEVPINVTAPANYTNVIPLSIDKDGTIFNGGKGWADNSRIGSGGIYNGNGTYYVTGHIEIDKTKNNTIYLENIKFGSGGAIAFFDSSFARVNNGVPGNWITKDNISILSGVLDGDNLSQFTLNASGFSGSSVVYFAIQADYIGDDSIITINEPID